MTSEPLHRPFIGIILYQDDYTKVLNILPTPSYTDILYSQYNQKIILIYILEGYITSPSQYRWISNIKLGLKDFFFVPFEFEEEFYITDTTDVTTSVYTIDELSKAFKAPLVTYPKIMYPSTKKELYRHLCWYGKRLIHQECFTKEVMTSTALLMNSKLSDRYSHRDLYKKVLGAYIFMYENREQFNIRLDKQELKIALSKGGQIRKAQRVQQTKKRVIKFLESGDFYKPNGKINISSLAKSMNMSRKTIAKYISQ